MPIVAFQSAALPWPGHGLAQGTSAPALPCTCCSLARALPAGRCPPKTLAPQLPGQCRANWCPDSAWPKPCKRSANAWLLHLCLAGGHGKPGHGLATFLV